MAGELELLSKRFKVSVSWTNQHNPGESGTGTPIPYSDASGLFWFFAASSYELAIKMIDGFSVNGQFWFFWGSLTDVQYTLLVVDTKTGKSKTYPMAAGQTCIGGSDLSAFPSDGPTPPPPDVCYCGGPGEGGWVNDPATIKVVPVDPATHHGHDRQIVLETMAPCWQKWANGNLGQSQMIDFLFPGTVFDEHGVQKACGDVGFAKVPCAMNDPNFVGTVPCP